MLKSILKNLSNIYQNALNNEVQNMKTIGIVIDDITKGAGTERAVINLSNMLCESDKYDVYIFSLFSDDEKKLYYVYNSKIKIIHLNLNKDKIHNKLIQIFMYFSLIKLLKNFVNKYKIDTILGTGTMINSILSFVPRKTKRIACEHMSFDSCPTLSKFARRLCYPKLDNIVLLTYSDFRKYTFISDTKKKVIPNSLSFITREKAELKSKRIIAVGRLTKQKGFDLLLETAVLLKSELPDWYIDIFGSGEDKDILESQIKNLKLEGFVKINPPTKNIQLELLNSSIYLMTSRWEGLPMILIEAKSCGLPCVSFDCPEGPADIIKHNEDGFLVEFGNIDSLAKYVIQLAKDRGLLNMYSQKAFDNSLEFSSSSILPKWEAIL